MGNKSKIRAAWKQGKWSDVRNMGAARMPPAFGPRPKPSMAVGGGDKFLRDVFWPSASRGTFRHQDIAVNAL